MMTGNTNAAREGGICGKQSAIGSICSASKIGEDCRANDYLGYHCIPLRRYRRNQR